MQSKVDKIWKDMYNKAKKIVNEREISPFIYGGQVATVLMTDKGNFYSGINIDALCDWGICAERSAILDMLKNNETNVVRVVTVDRTGEIRTPCGMCREAFMQLHKGGGEIEFLINAKTGEVVKLKELLPDWWGKDRF